MKKYYKEKQQTYPTDIDKFCEFSIFDQRRIAYYHHDVVCDVFIKGKYELTIKASATEISALVTKSKATRLEKFIKVNSQHC